MKEARDQAPTSLIDHPTDGSSLNCLARAIGVAREGIDEIVFLSGPEAAPAPGHVVLRNTRSGLVREPADSTPECSVEDYAAAHGRRVMAVVPVDRVRDILDLPPSARAAALSQHGGSLAAIAELPFGISIGDSLAGIALSTPPSAPSVDDKHVKSWLDAVGDKMSDKDKGELAQTSNDASTLSNWLDGHKNTDTMPQDVADAEKRLEGSDAVAKLLHPDGGPVTRDTAGGFLKSLEKAADTAKDSWDAFKKDNGSADAVATREAVDTSILQANAPILDSAGADSEVDGKISALDLQAVGNSDTDSVVARGNVRLNLPGTGGIASDGTLPSALKNAAAFYSDSGEFANLESAGMDPAKPTDGLVDKASFQSLMSEGASKSQDDTLSSLRSAALQDVSAGGDPSKINADYFKDPSKSSASGADKLAAMVQLEKTIARYDSGESAYQVKSPSDLTSPEEFHETWGDGPTPGQQRDDFIDQVKDRITTLSQDKDVQSLLTDKLPSTLQGLVGSDPSLKAGLQSQFDAVSSPDALKSAMAMTVLDGGPALGVATASGLDLTTTGALSSFVSKANDYAQALGITPDYSKALAAAPQDVKDKVKQGYDDIVSGKTIDDAAKSGTPQDKALIQAAADKSVYDSVLDQKTVQDGTDKFSDVAGKLGRAQLTDGKSGDDLLKGLGLNGEDDPKLQQLIQDNLGQLTPTGSDQASASDVLKVVRGIVDAMRSGAKYDDAVTKVQEQMKKPTSPFVTGGASEAYKSGALHAASAVLLAGGIGTRLSGGQSSATQTAQQSISAAGLLTEGGAKAYSSARDSWDKATKKAKAALDEAKAMPFNQAAIEHAQGNYDTTKAAFDKFSTIGKDVENVGKAVGGVAGNAMGFVTGIVGAVQAGKNGDTGGAAIQGTLAGLNGISTIANTAEVAAYVIPRVATGLASADMASLVGAVAGTIGSVVGGAAAVGGLIYSIVADIKADDKKSADEASWYKELQDGFAPSGVPMPDQGTLTDPPNGSVDDSYLPVAY